MLPYVLVSKNNQEDKASKKKQQDIPYELVYFQGLQDLTEQMYSSLYTFAMRLSDREELLGELNQETKRIFQLYTR